MMDAKKTLIILIVLLVGFTFYLYYSRSACTRRPVAHELSPRTILAFLGAPGSGKGTLAGRVVSELGFLSVSTGDLCRAEMASGSEKGKEIAQYMKGGLVPDHVITEMLAQWLSEHAGTRPVILDGYPRTQAQAEALTSLLSDKFADFALRVVYLQITDEQEVIDRITGRLICGDCKAVYNKSLMADPTTKTCPACSGKLVQREDDTPEIVRARLQGFVKNNNEIIAYYQNKGVSVSVLDVSHVTPEEIFQNFKKLIGEWR